MSQLKYGRHKNELGYNYLTNTSASHRKMKNTVSNKSFLALFKTKEVIIEECIFFSDSTCNRKGYRLGKQSSLSQSKFIYIEQRYWNITFKLWKLSLSENGSYTFIYNSHPYIQSNLY